MALFWTGKIVPNSDHVVVHLLELLLGDIESVGGRVQLVGLEGLIGEADLEGLVILLCAVSHLCEHLVPPIEAMAASLTSGTFSGSVCDEAASVVTNLKAGRATGATTLRRKGDAMLRLIVLDSIVMAVQRRGNCSGLDVRESG